jgi:hypothetical protein
MAKEKSEYFDDALYCPVNHDLKVKLKERALKEGVRLMDVLDDAIRKYLN